MIIGSVAMKHYFPDFPREPKDLDCIGEPPETNLRVERLENPVLMEFCDSIHHPSEYLLPYILLTLKVSHLAWDINWDKHMFDCQFLVKKGYGIHNDLFMDLYQYWNDYHGKNKRSDLQMSKEDFFNNAINIDIDHDYLHTLINPSPTYKKTLKEGAEVETEESSFWKLSWTERISLIQEECMVMAAERFQGDYYKARYYKMLKKFIQGHCPVYMIPFIVHNFKNIHSPPFDFMAKINTSLRETGKVELV